MKNGIFFTVVLAFLASSVTAAPFSPTQLKLTAPSQIKYNFDGSALQIPVTVSGTSAGVIFTLFTSGKAATIKKVHNGYLGWHYVNNIDTCVYASPAYSLDKGNKTITWDGKGEGGAKISAGDYTYYLWGWDNANAKVLVTNWNIYPSRGGVIEEVDQGGKPLANPLLFRGVSKWTLGNDPLDTTLRETTKVTLPADYGLRERIALLPGDYSKFFAQIHNAVSGYLGVWKFNWVPNGEA
ncbi:MAG: hypothetical protein ACYC9O_15140, partial [Candidatus Latescibacterota bacterium]